MNDPLFRQVQKNRPDVETTEALQFLRDTYQIDGTLSPLPSERDQNFRVTAKDGAHYTLKISSSAENIGQLESENEAMHLLATPLNNVEGPIPLKSVAGESITSLQQGEKAFHVRLLTFVEGSVLASVPSQAATRTSTGRMLASIDIALKSHRHPAARRQFYWDLQIGDTVVKTYLNKITDPAHRDLINHFLRGYAAHVRPALPMMRRSVIHHDGNDHNVIVREGNEGHTAVGIIDFGDMVYSCLIFELAVGCSYAILGTEAPVAAAAEVIVGYTEILPLEEQEVDVLFYLIAMRLCMSVTIAAHQRSEEPENEYLSVTEDGAWEALGRLRDCDPSTVRTTFRNAAGMDQGGRSVSDLVEKRAQTLGPSLSTSYDKPLKIVRGAGQYLYDDRGRAYLDAVNNVPHVGHCHPRVTAAAYHQATKLNTNTRYLHDSIINYAERLTATLPDPLSVCFFVNSGSEANDLALRLARAHTNKRGVIVIEAAYHGNLSTLIDISPYKFDGTGGEGTPHHVRKLDLPDPLRSSIGDAPSSRWEEELDTIFKSGDEYCAFIAESLLGCGGQIVLPDDYLTTIHKRVRDHGGVCIADEVQVGFGRVGTHFWGFETQGVVPDIVTLGKPIANGHPMGAVVTTSEIARSFDTGMEYFNTFGGNPVSCEIALTVLDVLEEQNLQQHALEVGNHLLTGLRGLLDKHEMIADVRGSGFFIGVELVRSAVSMEPADTEASLVVEKMKDAGILMSTDGPLHNVLKIKPPMVFNRSNADFLVATLDRVLEAL